MVDSQANKSNKQDNVTLLCSKFISGKEDPAKRCSPVIYHQNIHGLKGKINEFMLSLDEVRPHLICLTEHHHIQCQNPSLPVLPPVLHHSLYEGIFVG